MFNYPDLHLSVYPATLRVTTKERRKLMAHDLETQNGKTSFASFREPAWHGLGTVFTDEKTTSEMLSLASLDNWNVRLEDLETPSHLTSDKNYQYVLRTNPTDNSQTDILGVVGERYHVMQNEDLFSFGDNILDGGGRWETAGSIKGGRVVFGALALERETILDPNGVADKVKTYYLSTHHMMALLQFKQALHLFVLCALTLSILLLAQSRKRMVSSNLSRFATRRLQAVRLPLLVKLLGLLISTWTHSMLWLML